MSSKGSVIPNLRRYDWSPKNITAPLILAPLIQTLHGSPWDWHIWRPIDPPKHHPWPFLGSPMECVGLIWDENCLHLLHSYTFPSPDAQHPMPRLADPPVPSMAGPRRTPSHRVPGAKDGGHPGAGQALGDRPVLPRRAVDLLGRGAEVQGAADSEEVGARDPGLIHCMYSAQLWIITSQSTNRPAKVVPSGEAVRGERCHC